MLYTFIPYDLKKNIGSYYNKCMSMLPDDEDWAIFIDHDAMFTTNNWYQQITEVIERYPDAGLITCMTNRIYNYKQVIFNKYRIEGASISELLNNHDIEFHRELGQHIYEMAGSSIEKLSQDYLISGVVMIVKKKTWNTIKFCDGFLRVDNNYHRDCHEHQLDILLMTGLYVYHWYRANQKDVIIPITIDYP